MAQTDKQQTNKQDLSNVPNTQTKTSCSQGLIKQTKRNKTNKTAQIYFINIIKLLKYQADYLNIYNKIHGLICTTALLNPDRSTPRTNFNNF